MPFLNISSNALQGNTLVIVDRSDSGINLVEGPDVEFDTSLPESAIVVKDIQDGASNDLLITSGRPNYDIGTQANLHRQLGDLKPMELKTLVPSRHLTEWASSAMRDGVLSQLPLPVHEHQLDRYDEWSEIKFVALVE